MTVNDHVGMEPASVAQHDVFADDAVGTDVTTGADPRPGMDDGSWMNHEDLQFTIYDLRFTIYALREMRAVLVSEPSFLRDS
jgi:hypothetical protein